MTRLLWACRSMCLQDTLLPIKLYEQLSLSRNIEKIKHPFLFWTFLLINQSVFIHNKILWLHYFLIAFLLHYFICDTRVILHAFTCWFAHEQTSDSGLYTFVWIYYILYPLCQDWHSHSGVWIYWHYPILHMKHMARHCICQYMYQCVLCNLWHWDRPTVNHLTVSALIADQQRLHDEKWQNSSWGEKNSIVK